MFFSTRRAAKSCAACRRSGTIAKEAKNWWTPSTSDRIDFVKHYFGADWPTRCLYHVMINTAVGDENVISTILDTMRTLEETGDRGREGRLPPARKVSRNSFGNTGLHLFRCNLTLLKYLLVALKRRKFCGGFRGMGPATGSRNTRFLPLQVAAVCYRRRGPSSRVPAGEHQRRRQVDFPQG